MSDENTWRKYLTDYNEGLGLVYERFVLNVTDPWAKKWLRREREGRAWLEEIGFEEKLVFTPERECQADDPRPILSFASPRDGERIVGVLDIDSPLPARFDSEDQEGLEGIVRILEQACVWP